MSARVVLLVLVAALGVACGGADDRPAPTAPSPTPPVAVPPDVSGRWSGFPLYTLQVLRTSDNFQKAFTCPGTLTITQAPSNATLGGFLVVQAPCEPISFELSGTVEAGGIVNFKTHGPRPTEGPCPGGRDIDFSGTFANNNRVLSARGVTRVQCPEFGEHVFTYVVSANRS